jgi:hypothetical protein
MPTAGARLLAAAALLPSLACAGTTYMPRADGRISFTSSGSNVYLTKNGRRLESSIESLDQAVAGNPAAEEHARQRGRELRTGLALDVGGLVAGFAGLFVLAPSRNADGTMTDVSAGRGVVGGALVVGGLAAIFGAASYISSAQAHQWDAINIYNDSAVPPPSVFAPPAFAPPPFAAPRNAPPPPYAPSVSPPPSAAPPSLAPSANPPPPAAPPRDVPPPAVSPPPPPIYQAPPASPIYQAPPASRP